MTAIVLDLGGVLIDWNPRHLYRKLLPDETAVEEFLTQVCPLEWNEMQDAGRTFAEGIAERVSRYPEKTDLIRAYWERWTEMISGPFEDAVALFHELRQRHPVYSLTNWSAETWPYALDRFAFLGNFRGIVVSGHEGLAKPDPRIYRLLLERFELEPEETVFVDDNLRNVEAARTLGIDGIHYVGVPELRAALSERGLL